MANRASTANDHATIDLLQRLVRTCSYNPPGEENAVANIVVTQARAWGLQAELIPLEDRRSNLLIQLPDEAAGPTVLLCGHLDTVPPGDQPWEHHPLSGDVVDGNLHGRGSVDMKGGLVAMLAAVRDIAAEQTTLRGRVRLVGLVGEEVDCRGARAFLQSGGMRDVEVLIVGEPTSLDVVVAHRGALWLEVQAHGKTAHGSMPHLGVNAIDHLVDLLRVLREQRFEYTPHPLLAPPTMNVGTIRGGIKTNVVPDFATATVDLRTLPGQRHDELVDAVLTLAATAEERTSGLRFEVRVVHDLPPVETAADEPSVERVREAVAGTTARTPAVRGVSYYTDAAVLQPPSNVPTIIFGPGDETLCHQPNERIELAQVLAASRCYAAAVRSLLG